LTRVRTNMVCRPNSMQNVFSVENTLDARVKTNMVCRPHPRHPFDPSHTQLQVAVYDSDTLEGSI